MNNAIVYAFMMRLTVEESVLRSTFKLNTLYKKEQRKMYELPDRSDWFYQELGKKRIIANTYKRKCCAVIG